MEVSDHRDYSSFDGYFITPFAQYLPEVVPVECYKAYFQLILPKKWQDENYKPVILQIAGTGDQVVTTCSSIDLVTIVH